MARYIPQLDGQEGHITYHLHSDSKPVETAENICKVKTENADLGWEAWCSSVKRWYRVYSEPLVTADMWEVVEKQIYKMWPYC
jgi:hypothetical protein